MIKLLNKVLPLLAFYGFCGLLILMGSRKKS